MANIKGGSDNHEDMTNFNSSGLAIKDIVCAKLVYEAVKER